MTLTIGLMSGTSLDGVDGVLARFDGDAGGPVGVLAHVHRPFDAGLRAELLALCRSGADELHRAALAANRLMRAYAEVVAALRAQAGNAAVAAVGAHGQTVRHHPGAFDGCGYTLQLVQGALLAELTGLDVVCDFRNADLAAGGQGAPLVPAFHATVFSRPGRDVAVLNLGGIANLTLLPAAGPVSGFDCGPGNLLLDLWCQRHLGQPYDAGGAWTATGRVDAALLGRLAEDPFFARRPPKSTGRELFDSAWLDARLGPGGLRPVDVMATLAELTAAAAGDALRVHLPRCDELLVCGGGAFNGDLLRRLQARLTGCQVRCSDAAGVPPDQVEALAFAWLAERRLAGAPGNLPAVTGARGPRVLGALHAAPR